jgi:recombinational DNA repair protein (RecF pathway)
MVDAIAGGAPIDKLARYFEYWLLRLQGVYPSLSCTECSGSLAAGALMPPRIEMFVCQRCAASNGGTGMSAGAMQFLTSAGSTGPENLESLSLSPTASRELETAHRRLINLHLEKELKSARVLREMRYTR